MFRRNFSFLPLKKLKFEIDDSCNFWDRKKPLIVYCIIAKKKKKIKKKRISSNFFITATKA